MTLPPKTYSQIRDRISEGSLSKGEVVLFVAELKTC